MDQVLTELAALDAVPSPRDRTPHRTPRRRNGVIALLRPKHWLKGGLVLLAPAVTAPLSLPRYGIALGLTLLSFLAASSTIYVLNDLRDREADRLHPVKRLRPLASGQVRPATAIALLALMALITAGSLLYIPPLAAAIVGAYVIVNLWYCLALKHQPLVDVSVVAGGFVLRVLAGSVAAGLEFQPLLLICVYCACVALSLGKRRHELASSDGLHRPALAAYSVPFLDHVVVVNLVTALVGYVAFLWTLRPPYGAVLAVVTFPFASFTVYRYLQMVMVERSGGDPVDDLIGDRPMQISLGLWTAVLVPVLIVSTL